MPGPDRVHQRSLWLSTANPVSLEPLCALHLHFHRLFHCCHGFFHRIYHDFENRFGASCCSYQADA